MGLKFENISSGLVLFSVLVALVLSISSGIYEEYGVSSDYIDDDRKTVIEKLNDINFISGFAELQDVITGIYGTEDSTGSEFDILGSLRAGGIGTIKLLTGIITAPLEIIGVITGFYTIHSTVSMGLGLIIIIYLGSIVLSELLGK